MKIYQEWLLIPKAPFKILIFLLHKKPSSFSTDILLNYFMIDKNQTNADTVISALEWLNSNGVVKLEEKEKETFTATLFIPEGKVIEVDENNINIDDFRQKCFCVSVDWGVVLKVLFASMFLGGTFKRKQIAVLTGIGTTSVSNATKIIKEDFYNVYYKKIIKMPGGNYENKGVNLEVCAFDFRRKEPEKSCSVIRKKKNKNK